MHLKMAKLRKESLERRISELIEDFERESEFSVDAINIEIRLNMSEIGKFVNKDVKVDASIKL